MAKQPETKFKEKVLARLRELPYMWVIKCQMLSLVGIPDIIGCYRGKFFAWELKVGKNKPTKIQLHVLEQIAKAGGIAAVVRPENFESELEKLKVGSPSVG